MLQCLQAGFISHLRIRADRSTSQSQIKNTGLTHQRNLRKSRLKSNTMIFQTTHDSIGCCQSISGSARQYDGIQRIVRCHRRGKRCLPGSRTSTAYITACHCSSVFLKQKHRHTGLRLLILCVSHGQSLYLCDRYLMNQCHVLSPLCSTLCAVLHPVFLKSHLQERSTQLPRSIPERPRRLQQR